MPLSSRKSAWLAAGTTPCSRTHSLRSPRSSSSFTTRDIVIPPPQNYWPQCNSPGGKLSKGKTGIGSVRRRGFAPPGRGGAPSPHELRLSNVRTVLKVVLENFRRQRRAHTLPLRFDRAHHFSAADDFGGCQPRNFRRQHQADLQDCVRME